MHLHTVTKRMEHRQAIIVVYGGELVSKWGGGLLKYTEVEEVLGWSITDNSLLRLTLLGLELGILWQPPFGSAAVIQTGRHAESEVGSCPSDGMEDPDPDIRRREE